MSEHSRKSASRPRLGRGLAALLGETGVSPALTQPSAVSPTDPATSPQADRPREGVGSLPVEALEPGPFQPRQA